MHACTCGSVQVCACMFVEARERSKTSGVIPQEWCTFLKRNHLFIYLSLGRVSHWDPRNPRLSYTDCLACPKLGLQAYAAVYNLCSFMCVLNSGPHACKHVPHWDAPQPWQSVLTDESLVEVAFSCLTLRLPWVWSNSLEANSWLLSFQIPLLGTGW